MDNLALQLLSEMAAIAGTLQTLSDLVQRFNMNGDDAIDIQDSYADLRDFALLISQNLGGYPDIVEAAQGVIAAVEKYIIYEGHATEGAYGLDNSSGVSIFLPSTASSFYNPGNYDFATGTQWPTTNGSIMLQAARSDGNSWGSMLVAFFEITQPDGPDNPFPPPPISKRVPDEGPFVRIRREGINTVIEYGNGILQSADSVDGLWKDEDISSPATIETTSASRFFRVRR